MIDRWLVKRGWLHIKRFPYFWSFGSQAKPVVSRLFGKRMKVTKLVGMRKKWREVRWLV